MVLASLDLYSLFVEQVFGGLLIAVIGLGVIYTIIMALGKLNTLTILSVLIFYVMIVGILLSKLTFLIVTIGIIFYFFVALIRFFSGGLN